MGPINLMNHWRWYSAAPLLLKRIMQREKPAREGSQEVVLC